MKKLPLIYLVIVFFMPLLSTTSFSALNSKTSATPSKLNAFRSYEKQPLSFIENQGQVNNKVCYYSKGKNGGIYFTKDAIVYDLLSPLQEKGKNSSNLITGKQKACNRFSFIIKPVGANRDVRLYAKDKTSGRVNYLLGNNPERWHTNIPLYNSIIYRGLYKGIDLTIYGTNNQMEYDFIVSPGADPGLISLACEGIDALSVDKKGNLLIKTPLGNIKHLKPRIYQEIDGRRHTIDGSFVVSKNTFSFAVKNYNRDYTLIIDPLTLSYSTYLGGDYNDGAYEIAVDSSGNAYVTGYTWSTNFPSWSGYQWENWGKRDIFVTKFRQGDNALLYSTFLGGIESETGRGIAVDAQGNAYVTGYTDSSDFPVINAYQAVYGGGDTDAFVSKLGPDGFTLIYSTFLGGSESDWAYGIAVDSSGSVYVTGETYSTTFPTKNAYQGTGGGTFQDAFVTKLAPAGSSLSYSTFLGGGNSDWANSIAVDASGNAYVTGGTKSSDFPTHNAYQGTYGGGETDGFISKLGAAGNTLTYSTFLGGSKGDRGRDISVDSSGNAYVTGYTDSTNFPLVNAYQGTYGGGDTDAFISKLGPGGTTLTYSTFLGGSNDDWGNAITVDTSGNTYIIGTTESTDFPAHNAYQGAHGGGDRDAFISKLGPGGTTLTYSTFLGGSSDDWGNSIAIDASTNLYAAGYTASSDFP
ncbi:MAG: SBBP repeat-containing protein, partial [Deltaproteobacteria bacterium]|nr:SBBP repeat-containing protein [Deltaproteobacteria bacterium]